MSGLVPLFPFEHLAYKNTDNDEPDKCFINMYNEIFKQDSPIRLVKDKFDRNCIYPIIKWYDVSFTIYFTGIQLIRTRVEGTQSPYVYWRENHKKIIAVGTTSLRVLESSVNDNEQLQAINSSTKIFITPGYKFKIIDGLLTNFHLPKSTLFMLVASLVGTKNAHQIYQHAIAKKYRFYSYGDCSLLFKNNL